VIRVEWDLPATEGGRRGRVGEGDRVEKWPKQCMYMWINEQKKINNKKNLYLVIGSSKIWQFSTCLTNMKNLYMLGNIQILISSISLHLSLNTYKCSSMTEVYVLLFRIIICFAGKVWFNGNINPTEIWKFRTIETYIWQRKSKYLRHWITKAMQKNLMWYILILWCR
jgi:hypothetical protein